MAGRTFFLLAAALTAHGFSIGGNTQIDKIEYGTDVCNGNNPYSCVDCNNAIICSPKGEIVERVSCSGRAPFCKSGTGTCDIMPDDRCGLPDDNTKLSCMSQGFFPDPADCKKFHVFGSSSKSFTCLNNKYDPFTEKCSTGKTGCTDPPVECPKDVKGFWKVPFKSYKKYYVICLDGNVHLLAKCDPMKELNEETQSCEEVCPEPNSI